MPDFEAWKNAMPFGVNVAGRNMFDGKMYSMVSGGGRSLDPLLLFNKRQLGDAGLDPVGSPFTRDAFRAAATRLTTQGAGKYFGFLHGGIDGSFGGLVEALSELEHGTPGFDYRTGRYDFASDLKVDIIEMFQAMVKEKVLFPGWGSVGTDDASRKQFPLGQVSMMLTGAYQISNYKQNFPRFEYGVAAPPAPQNHGHIGTSRGGTMYSVALDAPDDHKAVAGDLLHFLGTPEGQGAWARYCGSANAGWSETAVANLRKSATIDPHDKVSFDLADEFCRMLPDPLLVNAANQKVALVQKPASPTFGEIVQGYLLGQVDNLPKALQETNDRYERSLDDAIAKVRKQGAVVSRADRVFGNWDPIKDYGDADYKER
ncbi:multiple sugar transport system substrate-binding protein [Kribbella aluminosa]|uniref:Multiple sugar transport system substrate-binding protein n=1 Tax=Kribbella aluminosa TaxID=416017 RepID=A0ABS4UWS5_9ACTN|nr:extracellular solute-binding protein [Kribbella aluminosa]MBP2356085.1 multiple sugar transport system substrate-binding protein [Kribbella aluminosa]